MAYRASNTNDVFSSATVWDTASNTPTLHASTDITIATTNLYTVAFTAPNTTNAATRVYVYVTAVGTGGTVSITLQENTADTAATCSIATTSLVVGWNEFAFGTPYVYTSTTAGYYRLRIVNTGATGTTTFAADSGGSNTAYLQFDNRVGALGATDNIFIADTITVDGTSGACGSGASTESNVPRTISNAISVVNGGKLTWDTVASSTLTVVGNIGFYWGSTWEMGTVLNPVPEANLCKLVMSMTVSGNFGILCYRQTTISLQGAPKSSTALWKTTLVSGTGTAASPLVVADGVNWTVGDEITVAANSNNATNYNENEARFIITKNSATSYVISTSKGGSEAALTNTHPAGSAVVNLERNVLITTNNTSYYTYCVLNDSNVLGDSVRIINIDWARFETVGTGTLTKAALYVPTYGNPYIDYTVLYRVGPYAFIRNGGGSGSYTGLVSYVCTGTPFLAYIAGINFTDCYAFTTTTCAFNSTSAATLTRCVAVGVSGITTSTGAFIIGGVGSKLISCESHCAARYSFNVTGFNIIVKDSLSGTKGKVGYHILPPASGVGEITFTNCMFAATAITLIHSNRLLCYAGTSINFQDYNQTDNDHRWFTETGTSTSTGSGLTDTTVHTTGGLGMKWQNDVTTAAFVWSFYVPTGNIQNKTMMVGVWCNINNAAYYGGAVYQLPRLTLDYDNGTIAYCQAAAATGWQLLSISFTPTTAYGQITLTLSTKTDAAVANSYVYWDDFSILYPAGYQLDLGAMDVWANGKPVVPPIATNLSALSVWTAVDTTDYGTNTLGNRVKKLKNSSLLVDGEIIV